MSRSKLISAAFAFTFSLLALVIGRPAAALDPARSLSQFEHTAWTVKQGAPPDIWALAQSSDGYLWLGAGSGLYRFDGVKFEHFRPDEGPDLPSNNITALLALPNGDLWIGYFTGGVSLLRNGRLTSFRAGVPSGPVTRFAQARDGTIWVATYGGLGRYAGGAWRQIGPEHGFPDASVFAMAVSRTGVLWVGAAAHSHPARRKASLFFLTPGSKRFEVGRKTLDPAWALAGSPDGRIWVSDRAGVSALPDDPTPVSPRVNAIFGKQSLLRTARIAFDRDGSLWGVQRGAGIFRTRFAVTARSGPRIEPGDRIEQFRMKDGLTSDIAASVLEDREGDIWVGTNLGLDRFRAANVVPERAIPETAVEGYGFAGGRAGAFYIFADRSIYRIGPDGAPRRVFRSASQLYCVAGGGDGDIWMGGARGLVRLTDDRKLSQVPLPADAKSTEVTNCAVDSNGAVWISLWPEADLFRLAHGRWRKVDVARDVAGMAPGAMAFDGDGGTWLSFRDNLVRLGDGRARLFTARDGLDIGNIQTVVPVMDGVMIGGDLGLARFDGRRMRSLRTELFPVLKRISGIAQTHDGDTWLNGIGGVIRLSTKDLNLAFEGRRSLDYQVLDFRDGLPGPAQQDTQSTMFEAWDGRLWLLTNHGVAWIDPSHMVRNAIPPPVSISSIKGDGTTRAVTQDVVFPSGTSNLQIDFTALSLQIPERVQFRYNLEGVDNGWINSGGRRQAFYTKIGPGTYRFRVIAANNDGVWNEAGSAITFRILPTFYQSGWFRGLCIAAVLLLIYFTYRIRIEYVSRLIRDKLAERMRERERIARELHDTLLQSVQGLTLSFRAAAARLPSDHAARQAMDHALLRAEQALTEGRDRVRGLRAADAPHDLSELFTDIAEKLKPSPKLKVRVITEGKTRELHPLIREELGRIGEEALFNTLRHAEAAAFEFAIAYGRDHLTVRFQDDGRGIDPALVQSGGRVGHFGIRGMRERAQRISGEFTLSSAAGAGAEIKVVVPGTVAYVGANGKGSPILRLFARRF